MREIKKESIDVMTFEKRDWWSIISKARDIALRLVGALMLVTIALISFYHQMDMTMFQIPFSHTILFKILDLMPIIVIVKAILLCKEKTLWLSLPPALVLYFAFPREHYFYEAFFGFLIIGCIGIRLKKIFCAAFIPATLVIINMMIASFSGAITSMVRPDRGVRSYWGHISPTDFGTAVLFIVIFAWILFKEIPEEFFLIPSLFSLYISFNITGSNTSGLLTILFMVMLVWREFEERVISKRDNLRWVLSATDMIMRIAFPVLGIIIVLFVYAFYMQMPYTDTLNTILHYRLDVPAKMYGYYGVKPFGTYFDMQGYGGSTLSLIKEYTFIDSSYPQILLRYGWMTYIVANILWVYTTDRAIKVNDRRLAFAMTLIAADFFMEHHWIELSYNAFVIIPFADFGIKAVSENNYLGNIRKRFEDKKYRTTFLVTGLGCLVVTYLLLPILFSYLRTIFNGYGFAGGGERAKTVFVVITGVVVLLLAIILATCNCVSIYVTEKTLARKNVAIIGAALVITIAMFIKAGSMIDALTVNLSARIDPEKDIINLITTNAEGKVYVDKLPEVYIKSGLDIDRAYYSGEDLARSSCATVVVDAPLDYACFISRGFLYLPISGQDAIYTNDEKVIKALKDEGYKLKGYNSYINSVDLNYTAEIYGNEMTASGGVLLGESSHSFSSLPKIDMLGAAYTVKYTLRIDDEPYTDDYKIGEVWVTSYDGEVDLVRADIMRSLFDENGELEYEMRFGGYGPDIEFGVNVDGDNKLEIVSIEYVQTPEYDVHVKVDSHGRVIRSEYYDLDGNPKEMPEGYQYLIREYDFKGNIIKVSYYDMDGNLVAEE